MQFHSKHFLTVKILPIILRRFRIFAPKNHQTFRCLRCRLICKSHHKLPVQPLQSSKSINLSSSWFLTMKKILINIVLCSFRIFAPKNHQTFCRLRYRFISNSKTSEIVCQTRMYVFEFNQIMRYFTSVLASAKLHPQ